MIYGVKKWKKSILAMFRVTNPYFSIKIGIERIKYEYTVKSGGPTSLERPKNLKNWPFSSPKCDYIQNKPYLGLPTHYLKLENALELQNIPRQFSTRPRVSILY